MDFSIFCTKIYYDVGKILLLFVVSSIFIVLIKRKLIF